MRESVDSLLEKLSNENYDVQSSAALELLSMVPNIPESKKEEVLDAFLKCDSSKDWRIRIYGAKYLEAISADIPILKRKAVIDTIFSLSIDMNDNVEDAGESALVAIISNSQKSDRKPIIDTLVRKLKSKSPHVREFSIRVLSKISNHLTVTRRVRVINALLINYSSHERRRINSYMMGWRNLFSTIPDKKRIPIIEILLTNLKDPSWIVRTAAARAFEVITTYIPYDRRKGVFDSLLICLHVQDSDFRDAVSNALSSLAPHLSEVNQRLITDDLLNRWHEFPHHLVLRLLADLRYRGRRVVKENDYSYFSSYGYLKKVDERTMK